MNNRKHKVMLPRESRQVTLTNLSDQRLTLGLWGANRSASVRIDGVPMEEEATLRYTIGGYPQAVLVHPLTGSVYVCDQMSGIVHVLQPDGSSVAHLQLEPSFPGTFSPVAMAADSLTGSVSVYIAGAVADQVAVITTDHQVERYIETGKRPLALAVHPQTGQLIVAHYGDNTVGFYDTTGTLLTTAPTGTAPRSIAIDPTSGKVYVAGDTITVIDASGNLLPPITGLADSGPYRVVFYPYSGSLYASDESQLPGSGSLHEIDTNTDQVVNSIPLGNGHALLSANPAAGLLVTGKVLADKLFLLEENGSIHLTLAAPGLSSQLAVDPIHERIWYTAPVSGQLTVIQGKGTRLKVSEDYAETNRDFQFQPALVHRLRLFPGAGSPTPDILWLGRNTPTGILELTPISLAQFISPQHNSQEVDITAIRQTMIDGHTEWQLEIAPQQTVTLLLTYEQVERSGNGGNGGDATDR